MNNTTNKVLALCALSSFSFNSVAADDEWSFQLEPYVMVSNIDGNASLGRVNGVGVEVDFDTILNNLDSAAMVHFEAHHDSGWGLALDYGYMDLSGKKTNANGSVASAGVRQGVLEGLAIYRTQISTGTLDYFAGVRWWDNDISSDISLSQLPVNDLSREVKADWIDGVVGVRWLADINDQWKFLAQADIGGYEANFTSTVQTGVQYEISELMTLDLKYKATWVDYDEGHQGQVDYFAYDTVTHGVVLGLMFKF
jgi:opacity protein-like surface antigen